MRKIEVVTGRFLLSIFIIVFLSACSLNGSINSSDVAVINEDRAELWSRANKAYNEKNWESSYKLYKDLKLNSNDVDLEFRFGVSAFKVNRIDEAERSFREVVGMSPDHQKALFNLALISLSKGHYYLYRYVNSLPEDMKSTQLIEVLDVLEKFSNN